MLIIKLLIQNILRKNDAIRDITPGPSPISEPGRSVLGNEAEQRYVEAETRCQCYQFDRLTVDH